MYKCKSFVFANVQCQHILLATGLAMKDEAYIFLVIAVLFAIEIISLFET